jgi:phage gpG-like protein
MSLELKIEGMAELQAALRKASAEAQEAVGVAVIGTAMELRGDIVKRIQGGPASGAVYTRGGVSHQASAPGEAPASDTGRLAGSITFDKTGPMSATVGSDLVYAAALEFGFDFGGGRVIDPRPAWVPAIEKITPKYIARLEKALGGSLK